MATQVHVTTSQAALSSFPIIQPKLLNQPQQYGVPNQFEAYYENATVDPVFKCGAIPKAQFYVFQFSQTSDFNGPQTYGIRVNKTSLTTKPSCTLKLGTHIYEDTQYFWRVYAYGRDGSVSPASDIRTFIYKKKEKELEEDDDASDDSAYIRLGEIQGESILRPDESTTVKVRCNFTQPTSETSSRTHAWNISNCIGIDETSVFVVRKTPFSCTVKVLDDAENGQFTLTYTAAVTGIETKSVERVFFVEGKGHVESKAARSVSYPKTTGETTDWYAALNGLNVHTSLKTHELAALTEFKVSDEALGYRVFVKITAAHSDSSLEAVEWDTCAYEEYSPGVPGARPFFTDNGTTATIYWHVADVVPDTEISGAYRVVHHHLRDIYVTGIGVGRMQMGIPTFVRVTGLHPDSPTGASDEHIFRGNVYANGPGDSATTTGITIRIADIAAGLDGYPANTLIGIPTTNTWTDKNANDVTETVYFVSPNIWWS